MSDSSSIKLQDLRTPNLLKRDSNKDFFQQNLQSFEEHLVLSPAANSAALRFPACNFDKKETPANIVFL